MPVPPPRPTPLGTLRPIATDAPVQAFKPLPEGASTEQLMHALHEGMVAYANAFFAVNQRLPSIDEKLAQIISAQTAERQDRARMEERIETVELAMGALETTVNEHVTDMTERMGALESRAANDVHARAVAGLPPMRAELPSQHDFNDAKVAAKQKVSDSLEQLASMTPGPNSVVSETPEKLTEKITEITESVIDDLEKKRAEKAEWTRLRNLEAAHEAAIAEEKRLEQERIDTEKKLREEAAKRRRDSVASIIVALVIAALLGAFGLLWGKSLGHDAGVAEGKASMPATVPVLVQMGAPSALPAAPVAAPAMSASAVPHRP